MNGSCVVGKSVNARRMSRCGGIGRGEVCTNVWICFLTIGAEQLG